MNSLQKTSDCISVDIHTVIKPVLCINDVSIHSSHRFQLLCGPQKQDRKPSVLMHVLHIYLLPPLYFEVIDSLSLWDKSMGVIVTSQISTRGFLKKAQSTTRGRQ